MIRWRETDVDRNGDDIVTADEAAHAWVETFHQLDRNGDDQPTQSELDQAKAQKAMFDQRFAKLDANGDGQISLDEYSSAGHDLMDFADLAATAKSRPGSTARCASPTDKLPTTRTLGRRI